MQDSLTFLNIFLFELNETVLPKYFVDNLLFVIQIKLSSDDIKIYFFIEDFFNISV